MKEEIARELEESIKVKTKVLATLVPDIESAAKSIISAFKNGNKLLLCGNGGSAADCQHIAAELIVRYRKNRLSLPAIALTTDTSVLTATANDYSYDEVFSKQVEGLANSGDVLLGISTSGNSKNIIKAFEMAKSKGAKTIGLLGCGGGKIAAVSDMAIIIPSDSTPRIQESHITIGHILCGLIEKELFK